MLQARSHSSSHSARTQRNQPQLTLGIAFIGFSSTQKIQVRGWIESTFEQWRSWREVTPDLADALCIHESAVADHAESLIALHSRFALHDPIRTDRALRPVAVASRAPNTMPGCVMFDVDSQYSVVNLFRKLESCLSPIRNEYAMGAALAAKHGYMKGSGVFHLASEGRLVAVADLNRKTFAARLPAHVDVLTSAEWRKRPDAAAELPAGFMARSLTDLLWTYTSRRTQHIVPPELRGSRIGLHQLPQVPMDRLNALHVKIMACVQRHEMTLDELYEEIGGPREAVERSTGALYYAGALSLSKPSSLQKLTSRLALPILGARPHGLDSVRQFFLQEGRQLLLPNAA